VELSESAGAQRARVYRTLAHLFRYPSKWFVEALAEELAELRATLGCLGAGEALLASAERLSKRLARTQPSDLEESYESIFEPSGGLACSPHETAHTAKSPQEAMLRTFELADIAGFYRAFNVEVSPGTERVDHIAAELEFMHLLALKEAIAETDGRPEQAGVCRGAARAFLRDHLGRWVSGFAGSLEETADPFYASAGRLLGRFIADEAARLEAG
jgi:DMSO reductase family type II enzyme chaperone